MATVDIDGTTIAYEIVGDGPPWVVTPGGRFTKEAPGRAGAGRGARRARPAGARSGTARTPAPPTSASPARRSRRCRPTTSPGCCARSTWRRRSSIGGSGGSRVSLLTAARHPDVAVASSRCGGSRAAPFGLLTLAVVYCGESIRAAWQGGMEAVVELPDGRRCSSAIPATGSASSISTRSEFIETLERWMLVYCPDPNATVPGLPDAAYARLDAADARVPQRRERSVPHPRHVRAAALAHPGLATRRSRRGATASGSSAATRRAPGPAGSSNAGRCSRRSSSRGRRSNGQTLSSLLVRPLLDQ